MLGNAACNYYGLIKEEFSLFWLEENTENLINLSEQESSTKVLSYLEIFAQTAGGKVKSDKKDKGGANKDGNNKKPESKLLAKIYLGKNQKKEDDKKKNKKALNKIMNFIGKSEDDEIEEEDFAQLHFVEKLEAAKKI